MLYPNDEIHLHTHIGTPELDSVTHEGNPVLSSVALSIPESIGNSIFGKLGM